MEVTKEEARNIVWEEHDDFELVPNTEQIIDTSRWSIYKEAIFLHKPTNKYYNLDWSIGATERQDEQPFDHTNPVLIEVEEKELLVKKWIPVAK